MGRLLLATSQAGDKMFAFQAVLGKSPQ